MQYTQFVNKFWYLFAPNSLDCLISSTILICCTYFRYSWFKDGDFDNIISSSSNLTVYLNLQAQVQIYFKQFSKSPNVNREIYEIISFRWYFRKCRVNLKERDLETNL